MGKLLYKLMLNKKRLVLIVLLLLVSVVISVASLIIYRNKTSIAYEPCENPGLLVPVTPKLKEGLVDKSSSIVIGKRTDTDRIKIVEVLKGSVLSHGDVIELCPWQVNPTEIKDEEPFVIFIKGKDRNLWIPTRTYNGVFPSTGKKDLFFMGSSSREKVYSLDEIKQAIRK